MRLSSLIPFAMASSVLAASVLLAAADTLPTDVRANFWAAPAVREAIGSKVLPAKPDGLYHGEAKVTHADAVIAIAKLAQTLEGGTWRATKSVGLTDKVSKVVASADWQTTPVTRFTLAAVLARAGDYFANGFPRTTANRDRRGRSATLPPRVSIKLSKSNPAYASLSYLAAKRMVQSKSPLLAADDHPLTGAQLSQAMSEMLIGLNDVLTPVDNNSIGNTKDSDSHAASPPHK